jgi:predicted TIM-barrel fold metal-dependent hydrolase
MALRNYLAGVATLDTLLRTAAARDISRFVIVQPSFYGSDNTLLLESLDALGDRGRGVAVVDAENAPAAILANYAQRGVRGLRVNLYSPLAAPKPFDLTFAAMARLALPMDWHVEVIASIAVLAANADLLARSKVPVVIDHYGVYGRCAPDSPAGRRLLDLLRRPHVWMKLSAPYRVSENPLNTRPDRAWIAAMLTCASERCVWGSDWPHTPPNELQKGGEIAVPNRNLSYAALVDDFLAALDSRDLADRIMQANPARLYGFSDSA